MTLYSLNGQYPQPMPFRIKLSNGQTRTDPTSFTQEEIADAGYVSVSAVPQINETQVLEWSTDLIDWVIRNKTEQELSDEFTQKQTALQAEITHHRNYLIEKGFEFNGNQFGSRADDQKRISGAALLAFIAISNGAQANDLLWHGGNEPFSWITSDNSIVPMDAQTVIQFGQTAAEHERAHIFAARALKDMNPIPSDYIDPKYWP